MLIYYLLPLDHTVRWAAITMLVIGLLALIALVTFPGPRDHRLTVLLAR